MFLSSSITMRSAFYWHHYAYDDDQNPWHEEPVGFDLQLADVGYEAMLVLAEASKVPRPEKSVTHPVAGWYDGWGMLARPKDLVIDSGDRCCRGTKLVENIVLDALNALYLNVRHGFIVMDSSVIMSLVKGYDKFRVSAEVRKQTHTIVFPFNANENHWFMVVMRKTLLFDTEVRST